MKHSPSLSRRAFLSPLAQGMPPIQPLPALQPMAVPRPPLAVIALNRMAYGPKPGAYDYGSFNAIPGASEDEKLAGLVESQLDRLAINDTTCDTLVGSANLSSLNQSLSEQWSNYYVAANADRIKPVKDVQTATFLRAVYSQRQLFEVIVAFWHNHFNINAYDYAYASATWASYDRDVIRNHAFGNFRQMLEAVATHPAMLFYLDNYINQAGGPNENWARELFELHTMGAENYLGVGRQADVPGYPSAPVGYVDDDVLEATRCFTGWRVNDGRSNAPANNGSFLYYDVWHDRFQKTVLGRSMPASRGPQVDGREVLDLVANHPGTARFISRKLCRRLIGDNPPQAVVDAAASAFSANLNASDQIQRVLRVILLSDAFKTTWGEKIKTPFEAAVSMLRAVNANFSPSSSFVWRYDNMNQPLFRYRTPEGYKDVIQAWSHTTSMLNRWQLAFSMVEGSITDVSVDILGQTPSDRTNSNALVDFWVERILGRPLSSDSQRGRLVDFMRGPYSPSFNMPVTYIQERLPRMVELLLSAPDFQYR